MRCLPVLDELSRATKGDVRLGILRGTDVLVLQPPAQRTAGRIHAESLRHSTVPAHAAAAGKALLAFSPPAVVDRVIDTGLPAFTPHTITSPEVLRQKLATIRLTQVASARDEFTCGTAAIAMPIFYGRGRVAAAIELNVADLGNELKPAASALAVACRSLSRQLATEMHAMGDAATIHHSEPTLHHHPNRGSTRRELPSRPLL
jgi:DNA-binding IclR family transcriptional regulator